MDPRDASWVVAYQELLHKEGKNEPSAREHLQARLAWVAELALELSTAERDLKDSELEELRARIRKAKGAVAVPEQEEMTRQKAEGKGGSTGSGLKARKSLAARRRAAEEKRLKKEERARARAER